MNMQAPAYAALSCRMISVITLCVILCTEVYAGSSGSRIQISSQSGSLALLRTVVGQAKAMGPFVYKVQGSFRSQLCVYWSLSSNNTTVALSSCLIEVSVNGGSSYTAVSNLSTATMCIPLCVSGTIRTTYVRMSCNATGAQPGQLATISSTLRVEQSDKDYDDAGSCNDPNPYSPPVTAPTLTQTQQIYIARNASISAIQSMNYGLLNGAQTKTINATGTDALKALRFAVTAEPGSKLTINFPLSLTLTRTSGPGTIAWSRSAVKMLESTSLTAPTGTPTAASGPTIGASQSLLNYLFGGTAPSSTASTMRRTDFWIGGKITLTTSTPSGSYSGSYTVTISNYSF